MKTNADPAVLWLDRSMLDIDKAKAALKRIADNGRRAGAVIGKHSSDVQEQRACSLRLTTVTFPGLGNCARYGRSTRGQKVNLANEECKLRSLITDMTSVSAPQRSPSKKGHSRSPN